MGTDLFLARFKGTRVGTFRMNPRPHQHSSICFHDRSCVSTAGAHQSAPIATIGFTRAHARTELVKHRAHWKTRGFLVSTAVCCPKPRCKRLAGFLSLIPFCFLMKSYHSRLSHSGVIHWFPHLFSLFSQFRVWCWPQPQTHTHWRISSISLPIRKQSSPTYQSQLSVYSPSVFKFVRGR